MKIQIRVTHMESLRYICKIKIKISNSDFPLETFKNVKLNLI